MNKKTGLKMFKFEVLPEKKHRVSITYRSVGNWDLADVQDIENAIDVLERGRNTLEITIQEYRKLLLDKKGDQAPKDERSVATDAK